MNYLRFFNDDLVAELDIEYVLDNLPEDVTIDYIEEEINELINADEVIYYTRASEYLAENDPSFVESLGLAEEYGYDMSRLDSEVLATLHNQQRLRNLLAESDLEGLVEALDSE